MIDPKNNLRTLILLVLLCSFAWMIFTAAQYATRPRLMAPEITDIQVYPVRAQAPSIDIAPEGHKQRPEEKPLPKSNRAGLFFAGIGMLVAVLMVRKAQPMASRVHCREHLLALQEMRRDLHKPIQQAPLRTVAYSLSLTAGAVLFVAYCLGA